MRNTMKNFMLGVTLVGGMLTAGAAAANAAPQDFHGRGGELRAEGRYSLGYQRGYDRSFDRRNVDRRDFGARDYRGGYGGGYGYGGGVVVDENYIPPSPGDGYIWSAGYYNGGIWVPGVWNFGGGYRGYNRNFAYDRGFAERGFHGDRGHFEGGRGFDGGHRAEGGFHGRR